MAGFSFGALLANGRQRFQEAPVIVIEDDGASSALAGLEKAFLDRFVNEAPAERAFGRDVSD
jgi:hypothetical protein